MKTKPFLLATAGSTVDGRNIDATMLQEMAEGYDPKTYGARLNIEHVRGISGQPPFRAYGDVLELSTGEVEVNFHGKPEKRVGLYGVFDVNGDAKALNDAGQKVYPSIEIEPNFAGKGKAYLMGVALTDSPASIATERLAFNRHLPGAIVLARGADGQPDGELKLEFAEASAGGEADRLITKFGTMLDGVFAKFAPKAPETPEPKVDDKPAAFNVTDLRPLFEDMGKTFAASIDGLRSEMRGEIDGLSVKLKAVTDQLEETPANNHTARPIAAGQHGKFAKTDC